ncbi:MAG: hypothetical protein Q4D92_02350 [Slackia sp.]|nr:hypothetical protein [Slackia sp.]
MALPLEQRTEFHALPEVVKWRSPSDELVGLALLARAAVERDGCDPSEVVLVVPSVAWGIMMHRACESAGVEADFLVPRSLLGRRALDALARLEFIAGSCDESVLSRFDLDDARTKGLLEHCGALRGFSLAKALGLCDCEEFRHALRHMVGDEDPSKLLKIVSCQIAHPTLPSDNTSIPIMHCLHVARVPRRLFFAGCVEGLVPVSVGEALPDRGGRGIFSAFACEAREQVVFSYFTSIEERIAERIGIVYARTRTVDGVRVAMTRPSRFLNEGDIGRYSTDGGQALLRRRGLN